MLKCAKMSCDDVGPSRMARASPIERQGEVEDIVIQVHRGG